MRLTFTAAALLAAVALLPACGSAGAATRGYTVTDFEKIQVDGSFNVHVHTGAGTSAKATGAPAALDRLSVEVQGGTLVIKPLPGGWGGWPGGTLAPVTVEVTTRSLSGIALSGSGDVTVDRVRGDTLDVMMGGSGDLSIADVGVTRLGATLTGSGDLSLGGRAVQARAILRGSGTVHGEKLMAESAEATLIGSGDLSLGARRTAKVSLTGSGNVAITGPATCAVTRTGSGDVRCGGAD